ncbi:prk1p [Saccharomyces arboricola H-6]|uniref:non-specific serine/threonine protein kinase n=1 Tax=Saccharomyces arboricola (strain H-6 / AS 2.3317 / CBS 10644) TaxID=1160507 RepID=J8PMG6_SACAR|nr:prk1p [Saccharomyces arboricola H-6]
MNTPQISLYKPETILTVGSHHAKIIKYLTSGGFAQVYSAEISPPDPYSNANIACLKRVIVPDKQGLNTLRAEVDAMKLLKNNKHVVSYIDSHAAKSVNGMAYEVFLLMEFCERGGLIDFMNTRLQNRLQEPEILEIMSQTVQGVSAMHALQPPLIHRDIKIENVLISHDGLYKVCDFGSVSGVIRPPRNPQEFNYVQHDILTNTTAQYRSPEMIDLYRGLPIDEKSDIWALGVFLYKICYYTTPFEKSGEAAILHARYQYPSFPQYSDRLKNLIRLMLMEAPSQRPNICQVLEEVSRLQNKPCPIRNFYLLRAMNQNAQLTSEPPSIKHIPAQQLLPAQSLQSIQQMPSMIPISHVKTTPNLDIPPISINNNDKIEAMIPVGTQLGVYAKSARPLTRTKSVPLSDDFASLYYRELHPFQKSQTFKSVESFQSPPKNSISSTSQSPVSNRIYDRPSALNRPNNYVDSETQTIDSTALPNLKQPPIIINKTVSSSKEPIVAENVTGGNIVRSLSSKLKRVITGESRSSSPIKSRQNTGDSIRSAFGMLRHGFTGSSISNSRSTSFDNNNGNNISNGVNRRLVSSLSTPSSSNFNSDTKRQENLDEKKQKLENRRSLPPSILSDFDQYERSNLNTGSREYYRSHSPVKKIEATPKIVSRPSLKSSISDLSINQEKKESIQRRVHNLLKNSEDPLAYKPASVYGKYTDIDPEASNRHSSVRITPITEEKISGHHIIDKTNLNGKLKSKPPRPPPKPPHLRTEMQNLRKFSRLQTGKLPMGRISSEATETIVDVNVDDLEADFRKRFPSKV